MAKEITRREQFYAAILGEGQIPEPKTREEQYLQRIAQNGGGGGGTTNYNDLNNKPQINGVALQGNKSISDLFDGKVDIGIGTVEESGYAELKDENGDRIFRASSANGEASVESGGLIGQPGALVLYNGEGGLSSVRPKSGVIPVEVDLPAESGTLALDEDKLDKTGGTMSGTLILDDGLCIIDDTTGVKYKLGIDNGLLYYEEVQDNE